MGAVFEAVHESLNQRVAIKVMHAKLSLDKDSVQRFMNEARTTSLVHHVGLVRVYDYGQLEDGSAYMMMEFLEGESLRARLAKLERLAVPDALRVTRQIAAALAAAHDKGVVHRDLKPENVLMVPDPETPSGERAKVLDFGIAKVMEPEGGEVLKTTTGAILGTPTYMSPEQCRGVGKVTEKSDVYSLGCMLYQMLAGRPPFVGSGSGDLIAMHIMEQPQQLRELAPGVSPEVETLTHQMLEKKPEVRPSMRQVLSSLEQLGHLSTASGVGSVIIVAPPPGAASGASKTGESLKPKSSLPMIVGIVGVLAIGGIVFAVSQNSQPKPPPQNKVMPVAPTPPEPAKEPSPPTTQVTLAVASQPAGAQVLSSPELKPLGVTPWQTTRDKSAGKLEVVVRLKGYYDQKLIFDGSHDDSRPIALAAMPVTTPTATPVKKNILAHKPTTKPKTTSTSTSTGTKKSDDDLDVPVVR
jgi:serine/threonine protein kinase